MNTPVISAETANRLNRLVQTQIDSRLFLFCNYEPTHSYTISEDAQFLTAVQDLYKFAIDSSGILQYYYRYVPKADQYQFKPLSGILDKIKALRSVIDHNQSAANGMVEQNLIQICATWVERVRTQYDAGFYNFDRGIDTNGQRSCTVCRELDRIYWAEG